MQKSGEKHGAPFRRNDLDLAVAIEEIIERDAVGMEQALGARVYPIEVVEGDDAEQFGWVGRNSKEEIAEAPDALGQSGLGENPATAESA